MAEKNNGTQLVVAAALLGCFVAVCFPAACVCRETAHKEKIFFNGDDLDTNTVREVYAPIGGQAVLECEAGGTPAPLIHWLRNGQRIDQGGASDELVAVVGGEETLSYENTETNDRLSTLQLSATKSRLYVDCVGHVDAGVYVCVAETPTRRIAVDYRLIIETRKVFGNRERSLRKHHLETHQHRKDHSVNSVASANRCFKKNQEPAPIPARIYMWTLHRVEIEGADVQLYCRPTGSGPVKVTWLDRDGEPITKDDPQYQVEENGDLLVKSISFADNMGLYRCVAENEFSTDTVETFLYPAAREKKRV